MSVCWLKVWDEAADWTVIPQAPWPRFEVSILKLLCKSVFVDRKCPVELFNETIPSVHAFEDHFLTQHTDLSTDIDSLFDTICHGLCSEKLFTIGLKLSNYLCNHFFMLLS